MAQLDLLVNVETKGGGKLDKLGSGIANIAKVAAGATAAFVGVGAVASGFASDMNESLAKVDVVFGDNARAIKNWSDTAATAMGLSQQSALEAAGTFGNLFDSMGITEDASFDMSKELVQLASDLASFNNISTDEALIKLRAGLVGEAEPLRTLGVNISAAATKTKALELGLIGVGDELTAADKAAANYAIIMEQTANAQGDFARTSDGMANQQRILAATFGDTMADLGQAFIPLVEMLLPMLTAGLQSFGAWVTTNMPTIKEVLSNVLSGIGSAITFLTETVLPAVIPIFQTIVTWFMENLPSIQTTAGGVFDKIGEVIGFVTEVVVPPLLNILGKIVGFWVSQGPKIMGIAEQVFGAIEEALRVVMPILTEVAEVTFPIVSTAADLLFTALDIAFKGIGGAFEVLGNVFETVSGIIEDVVGGVIGAFKEIYNGFARFWNSIKLEVPSVDLPLVGRVGGFTIGLPQIPMLAAGGIITSPTLAMIGEKGPEAVIPLDKMQGQTTIIEVTVLGDLKAEDERSLADAIGRVQWASGFSDQVLAGG